ncbi:MAG: caspase family protein [Treponema sp.]|nr:caspase family protein [Treponema sp.]
MKKYFLLALCFIGICLNVGSQEVAVFPQLGHTGGINKVALSPDGKTIASGSYEGTIKIWDIITGREIRTFYGHLNNINDLTFSSNGKQIISGSSDNTIKIWDVYTENEIRTLPCNPYSVACVAINSNGNRIVSGINGHDNYSSVGLIKIWDAITGREINTLSGYSSGVFSLAISPDDRHILFNSYDGKIKILDIATGREIRTFSGHSEAVSSVAYSSDGRWIVSSSLDKKLKLWDVDTGREIRTFSGHSEAVFSVTFSSDNRQIISYSSDNAIKLWDTTTGKEIKTFYIQSFRVNSIAFSSDSKQIVSGSSDNTIKLFDTATGKEIRTFSCNQSLEFSVALSSDGKQIISSGNKTIKLWNAQTGQEIKTFSGGSGIFSSDGRQVVNIFHDNKYNYSVELRDVRTYLVTRTFSIGYHEFLDTVVLSQDGKNMVVGSNYTMDSGTIKLWDVSTGREIRTFNHSGRVSSLAFSSDGKQILSGSSSGAISLWDISTGHEIKTILGHSNTVTSVMFSPDGKKILSAGDRTIKIWDASTGNEERTFSGHSDWVSCVAYSLDGKQIVSSGDKKIKLWNAQTGREIKTFSGYSGYVNSLAFSPDNKKIISCSDYLIKIWDIDTSKEIAQFISFIDDEWIVITPDGYYNASPNGDRYLNVRVGNNVYGIDQYRNTFYNPQIVEARLQGKPDPVRKPGTIQKAGEPPTVIIKNPESGTTVTAGQVELSVLIESKQSIQNIRFLVNGRLISSNDTRGSIRGIRGGDLEAKPTGISITRPQQKMEFSFTVNLDSGRNFIEVIAENPHEGRTNIEVISQQAAVQQNALPNLWILSIGVNKYNSPLLRDLNFAVNDAREIVNTFKAQEGRVYGKVNSLLVADGAALPTRANIMDGFDFIRRASPTDVIVLFIAGHGINDENGNYYFMPSDASFANDGAIRSASAISFRDIQSVLDSPGQKLVFIDSCHSAGASNGRTRAVDNTRLVGDLRVQSYSTVIFTASKGDQFSQERDDLKHGVFTYALIQGMKGAADLIKDNIITMDELRTYVSDTIPKMTGGVQQPTTYTPEGYTDFKIARTR